MGTNRRENITSALMWDLVFCQADGESSAEICEDSEDVGMSEELSESEDEAAEDELQR